MSPFTTNDLSKLKMKYPEIDDYILKFKSLVRTTDYILGNQETINMFLMGLNIGIATDLLKQNSNMGNYNQCYPQVWYVSVLGLLLYRLGYNTKWGLPFWDPSDSS